MRTTNKTRLIRACASLFIACLYGCSASSASAQRNPVHRSIEAQVARADGVYVGTVSQIGLLDYDKDGAPITVDATETLKGSPHKRFKVFAYGDKAVAPFRTWILKRTPLLWFVQLESAGDGLASPSKRWCSLTVDPAEAISPFPVVGYFSMYTLYANWRSQLCGSGVSRSRSHDCIHRQKSLDPHSSTRTTRLHSAWWQA